MKLQYLFISTGEKLGFYTLKGMYEVKVFINGETRILNRDYFHKNLSIDKAKAETLAKEAAEFDGVPFYGNAEFDLKEIACKRDGEAAVERERVERAIREAEEAEVREFNRVMQGGIFIMGKYTGQTPEAVYQNDPQYVRWLAGQFDGEGPGRLNVNRKLAHDFIQTVKQSEWIGTEGKELEVNVQFHNSFWTNGRFPTLVFQCADKDGNCVTFFSTAKAFKELQKGDQFTVKGIVKEHYTDRNGTKSTTLNKPKMVKI